MALSSDQYKQIAVKAAQHYGIPVQPFLRQLNQESGFRPGLTSGAGAKWIGQFIPSTAKAYGVHDDVSSIWGAAHYMSNLLKSTGSMQRALSAYNSGRPDAYKDPHFAGGQTYNYVRNIMGGSDIAVPGGAPAAAVPAAPGAPAAAPNASLAGAPDAAAQARQQAAQIRQAAIGNLHDIAMGEKPTEGLTQLASFIHTVRSTPAVPTAPAAPAATPDATAPAAAPAAAPVGPWKNYVTVAPTADRVGVPIVPGVLNFVAKIARTARQKLTIGTGSNHNQYVLGTHRESQHWTGHAADIPMSGDALTRLGQQALIAAGMPRAKALQQTGGVYNIGPYQILFNTMTGGNHFNHLHVGVR